MKWTVDPHGEGYILQAADFLRKGIPDAKASFYRDRARGQGAVFHILGNTLCQLLGFQGHEIHQVVNVKHVSGGEKPVLACLIMLIHNKPTDRIRVSQEYSFSVPGMGFKVSSTWETVTPVTRSLP